MCFDFLVQPDPWILQATYHPPHNEFDRRGEVELVGPLHVRTVALERYQETLLPFAHANGKRGPYLQLQTRCDGTQPSCKTCEVYHDECRYEKPPPMSQIISMASRLQEAEQTILQLRKDLERESAPLYNQTALVNATASPEHEVQPQHRDNIAQHRVHIPSNGPTSEELLSDLSLDEHGKVSINMM